MAGRAECSISLLSGDSSPAAAIALPCLPPTPSHPLPDEHWIYPSPIFSSMAPPLPPIFRFRDLLLSRPFRQCIPSRSSPHRHWLTCIIRCNHSLPDVCAVEGKSSCQLSSKQEFTREVLLSYRDRFTRALKAEFGEEMGTIKERIRKWSKTKLQAEGFAMFDLYAENKGSLFRNRILELYSSSNGGILPPQNQFNQVLNLCCTVPLAACIAKGRQSTNVVIVLPLNSTKGNLVVMSLNHPLDGGEDVVEAIVMERTTRYLKVAVPWRLSGGLKGKKWRLDLYANHIAHERCLFAINIFASPFLRQCRGRFHLEDAGMISGSKVGSFFEKGVTFGEGASAIRALIMRCEELHATSKETLDKDDIFGALDELKATRNPPTQRSGKNLGDVKASTRSYLQSVGNLLNHSQKIAIERAAVQRVTLWQGPPGTGKTTTLSHLIDVLCKRNLKILACADSNVAVDNLVEKLLGLGLNVVRVGQPAKVRSELHECTVNALLAKHPLMNKVKSKKESKKKTTSSKKSNDHGKRADGVKTSKRLKETAEVLEARALKDVLDRADVIASTCIGAADDVLKNRSFGVCVIDEATQATEPASLVPILRSGANSVVLVGDPLQLPPTVLTSAALKEGLDVSLYQHLEGCGMKACFLDTQYRMHPEIAVLPSKLFYSGRLKTDVLASDRPAPCGIDWPKNAKPILFMDCMDSKEASTSGNSVFNRVEAIQALKVLQLLESGNDIKNGWESIGVVAPYHAQVRLLHDMIFVDGKDDKYKGLEIKTIDGFQGREKEVIIFSTVRSNNKGQLGFLRDPRRMNVALTRAKSALIVIGNSRTLGHSRKWAIWLSCLRKKKLIRTIK